MITRRNKKGQWNRLWIARELSAPDDLFFHPDQLPRRDVGPITEYHLTSFGFARTCQKPDMLIWLKPRCGDCDDDSWLWLPGDPFNRTGFDCVGMRAGGECHARFTPYRPVCWQGYWEPRRRYNFFDFPI